MTKFYCPRPIILTLLLCILTFGPLSQANAQGQKFDRPMTEDSFVMLYDYGSLGEMRLAVMITPVHGHVAVCGFWTETKPIKSYAKSSGIAQKHRGSTSVHLKGTRLLSGLNFVKRVSVQNFAVGAPSTCRMTHVPWQKGFSIEDVELNAPRLRIAE